MINNKNFLLEEIPKFHAISQQYDRTAFWKENKKLCIEGFWSGGKWMPGTLYYYCNFHTIRFEEEGAASRKIGRPWLRDIEWEKAYIYEEALGFSGFSNDNAITCDRKYGPEKDRALKFGWITEDQLKSKIYIPAREYLRKLHPSNVGKPLYANQAKNVLDLEARGGGKDLEDNTLVYKKDGPIKIVDINIGDLIYGADGQLTNVVDKKHFDDQLQYRITFADDRSILCGGGHLWNVTTKDGGSYTLETEYIYNTYKGYKRKIPNGKYDFDSRYFVQMNSPIVGEEINLPIEPYYLGLWLGDGNSHNTGITTIDDEIKNYIYDYSERLGLHININLNKSKTCPTYNLNGPRNGYSGCNILLNKLRSLDLLNNKHIPDIYLNASFDQKLELLKGLMDSDGHIGKTHIEFTSSIPTLANDFIKLCRVMGIRINITTRIPHYRKNGEKVYGKLNYRFSVKPVFNIFKLSRKSDQFSKLGNYSNGTHRKVSIKNVEPVSIMSSTCIAVDNNDKLFIAGDYIVTHNSFWSSALILHNFLFDGSYDYDMYLSNKKDGTPLTSDTVVGAIESKYSDDLLKKVKIAMEHLPDKQTINNEIYPSPLWVNFSGSLSSGKTLTSSVGSMISHRTFMDNALSANGLRPNRAFLEEIGFLENIVEVIGALEATQASSDFKNLVIYMLGTGGLSAHGAITFTKEIFYNPEEFNCLSFEDIWEKKGKIGFFLPATHTINKFKKGENLITDEANAKIYVEEEIDKAKKSGNRRRYMAEIINKPLKPSDIFLTVEGNFFPIDDLREHLASIENNKRILDSSWKVEFYIKDGKCDWNVSSKPVLRDFPHKRGDNLDTAMEVWELPKMDSTSKPPYGRYLASLDPVDNDGGDDVDHSLMSGFIMDSWTDRLVLEYTGRTKLAEEFYEQWRRALIYYNAICIYERNLKGFFGHMKKNTCLSYLCEQPEVLNEKGLVQIKGAIGNQTKGVHCTTPIINWGLELLLNYINSKAYDQPDIEDEDESNYVRNLSTIRSTAALQEMLAYNSEINADRISSLILLMILREDRINLSKNAFAKKVQIITQNKFWDRAYKKPYLRQFNPKF